MLCKCKCRSFAAEASECVRHCSRSDCSCVGRTACASASGGRHVHQSAVLLNIALLLLGALAAVDGLSFLALVKNGGVASCAPVEAWMASQGEEFSARVEAPSMPDSSMEAPSVPDASMGTPSVPDTSMEAPKTTTRGKPPGFLAEWIKKPWFDSKFNLILN